MENRELKPCECGGEAELVSTFVANDYDGDTFYQVSCKRCKKRGLAFGKILTEAQADRIKKAVISWNFKIFDGDDLSSMLHAAFSAIQGLSEENERLRARYTIDERYKFCNLVGDTLIYNKTLEDYNKLRADFRADTVRKMQSEIKERCIKGGIYPAFVARTIDQIAKEITENN